jgi:hypothetical protein
MYLIFPRSQFEKVYNEQGIRINICEISFKMHEGFSVKCLYSWMKEMPQKLSVLKNILCGCSKKRDKSDKNKTASINRRNKSRTEFKQKETILMFIYVSSLLNMNTTFLCYPEKQLVVSLEIRCVTLTHVKSRFICCYTLQSKQSILIY